MGKEKREEDKSKNVEWYERGKAVPTDKRGRPESSKVDKVQSIRVWLTDSEKKNNKESVLNKIAPVEIYYQNVYLEYTTLWCESWILPQKDISRLEGTQVWFW